MERDERADLIDEARATLGADAFEVAAARGKGMALEEVVVDVLAALDDVD